MNTQLINVYNLPSEVATEDLVGNAAIVIDVLRATTTICHALDAGATDFVQKPSALATDKVLEMSDDLVEKVKAAAGVKMRPLDAARVHSNVPAPRRDSGG